MERRVFSLTNTTERTYSVLMLFVAPPIWGIGSLAIGAMHRWVEFYVYLLFFAAITASQLEMYLSNQFRTLEVTDEGLLLRKWLRRPVNMHWDAIAVVELTRMPIPFRRNRYRDSSIWIKDAVGRRIRIRRTCQASSEILGFLKQRLPEGVFQERKLRMI